MSGKNKLFIFIAVSIILLSWASCTVISNSDEGSKKKKTSDSGDTSSASSSVSSGASSGAGSYIFFDDFTSATDSTLLTAGYTGYITNDPAPASPMYIKVGGTTVSVSGGDLTITGARLTIGANASTATTSGSTPGGCFDLSSSYTVIIGIKSASGSGNFQVMIDNNTTSGSSSPLGSSSRFYSSAVSGLSAGELVITNAKIGTTGSFICLRTESSATVVIDYIRIEGAGSTSSSSGGSSASSGTSSSVSSSSSSALSSFIYSSIPAVPSITEGSSDIYVSPSGASTAAGTPADPMDLVTAISAITAGSTIWMMNGTYAFSTQVTIARDNCGISGSRKNIAAVNPGSVILDFSTQIYSTSDTSLNGRGLQINGHYWHIKGLRVYKAADNGIFIGGNCNIVENCVLQANRDSGLQISRYVSTLTSINDWPSYNLIINCESYDNCDPATGENADGFACKLTAGYGNIFKGCISHNNCDDGWDLYTKTETGVIGTVVIDQCIAYSNGTLTDGTATSNGDRNGFKLGGADIGVIHYVTRSIAFNNGKNGFTWNSNPAAIEISNCLAWNNVQGNYKFDNDSNAVFYNNISYWTSTSSDQSDRYGGNSGAPTGATNCFWFNSESPYTWNDLGLQVTSADFANNPASITSVTKNADGSPVLSAFRLASGSDLINAGIIPPLHIPYDPIIYFSGNPDLGAYETE